MGPFGKAALFESAATVALLLVRDRSVAEHRVVVRRGDHSAVRAPAQDRCCSTIPAPGVDGQQQNLHSHILNYQSATTCVA